MAAKILFGRFTTSCVVSLSLWAICVSGCAGPASYFGRGCVSESLDKRTGHRLPEASCPGETTLPEFIDFSDGLTEQEAVTLALWNSPSYQELLADLGLAGATVIEASQLTNPEFGMMFPVGVKQLEFTLAVPLESLWLRPKRVAAAELESQRVGNRLVQDGLDLVRDVRLAHADLALAQDRLRLADEAAELRGQIADLAEAQLAAGTTAELDVMTSQVDELIHRQYAGHLVHEVELARERLRLLMGLGFVDVPIEAVDVLGSLSVDAEPDGLVHRALSSRPDLWSARFAYKAACWRVRLANCDYLKVTGIFPDANGSGPKGFEAGPGVNFTVPIFNQNQGAIARADAEADKALRSCELLRQQIATEVRQAHTRVIQAREDLTRWQDEILPVTEETVTTSEKAYKDGAASLLLMLVNSRQLLDVQLRRAESAAALRKAVAELERSMGESLDAQPALTPVSNLEELLFEAPENTP